ncbi:hypothetical protein [Alkalibacillus haloalkaliphilus]|uniref:Uncharacterized protein n=1 Tax=Alkalibacillus haloalkaliphilus TaxID=94136 RepID=A0A511W9H6_9BACI|nr:hypothetical protein [Alkalibacillus haloalkaliphilus]GEN46733.1 hypothetical protein AHA02nite_25090 [Alkalibacillus haloalkaliphilus]
MKSITRTLVLFIGLLLVAFPTNTFADEEEYETTCEMTIDGNSHDFNNQADATDPCDTVWGYYQESEDQFYINGSLTYPVEYNGQEFENVPVPRQPNPTLTVYIIEPDNSSEEQNEQNEQEESEKEEETDTSNDNESENTDKESSESEGSNEESDNNSNNTDDSSTSDKETDDSSTTNEESNTSDEQNDTSSSNGNDDTSNEHSETTEEENNQTPQNETNEQEEKDEEENLCDMENLKQIHEFEVEKEKESYFVQLDEEKCELTKEEAKELGYESKKLKELIQERNSLESIDFKSIIKAIKLVN